MIVEAFSDFAAYTDLPRLTGLTLSVDGTRLVGTVQQPDAKRARYTSALWEIPIDGSAPVRLTHSDKGESAPCFLPDGSLLFLSARPDATGDAQDEAALWQLPPRGEARMILQRPGGIGAPVAAARSGSVLVAGSRLLYSTDDNDAERRRERKERKVSAILHTGMPLRYWDHELGDESARLLLVQPGGGPVELAPDATIELAESTYSIDAAGTSVATTWRVQRSHGRWPSGVAVIDVASQRRVLLAAESDWEFGGPVISPDGSRVALLQEREGRFGYPPAVALVVVSVDGSASPVTVNLGDLHPTEWVWSADGTRLLVAGDLHGRGAVLMVDPIIGAVQAEVATDAVYSSLCPDPSGRFLFALRSAVDSPPAPVRLDLLLERQFPMALATPAPVPPLPGSLVELSATGRDGVAVHGWLVLPPSGPSPAPVMLWIHGGPFGSWNSWSWRWNPWVAAAQGWAVVLPDPALSTGYGHGWLERAWPYEAADVFADCETVLDSVLLRPDIDSSRVACLGASFGGYMTNWIAGHTARFGAIVTHAGLWALDQQHMTTDGADYKTGIFGVPDDHPEWYEQNSPHNSADAISTPMLIVHGNRDYRVPISEALRLWWDLARRHDGPPETMAHRFLQLTGENHWVLSPANAEIWYSTVFGFCGEHVLGQPFVPSPLL
ncbi:prolyl oligopeptidase family serine peptidase [Jatrophihabitans sp.]|uniref:S9 family peptidase n=1 Tax=Jatrophihabitans sp. TaxID=1932789 RepID=UPI0030C77F8A|nr:family peptidase [Jatrophihabitans sp.]